MYVKIEMLENENTQVTITQIKYQYQYGRILRAGFCVLQL
jgi:hypothetical protein